MAISNTVKAIGLSLLRLARIVFVATSVFISSATTAVLAEDIPTNEREWHVFYVQEYNIPVYEKPSRQSRVVTRLGKGDTVSNYIRRGAKLTWEQTGWFYYREVSSRSTYSEWERFPGGWVEIRYLLPRKNFHRVVEWPFRFLVIDWGGVGYSKSFCFKANGEGQYLSRREDDSNRSSGPPISFVLYLAEDILATKELSSAPGRSFALFDRKRQRLCPIGHTEKECDRVAKEEGNVWMFALFSDHSELAKERYSKYCLGKPYLPGADPFKHWRH